MGKRGELPYVKNGTKVYLFCLQIKQVGYKGQDKRRQRCTVTVQTHKWMHVNAKHTLKDKRRTQTMTQSERRQGGIPACPGVLKIQWGRRLCMGCSMRMTGDVEIRLALGARQGGVSHQDQLSNQCFSGTFTSAGETTETKSSVCVW